MVLAHSLAMNGGVVHAIELLSAEERAAAFDAYRYFGLDAAADVLADVACRCVVERLCLDVAGRSSRSLRDTWIAQNKRGS